MISVIIPAYGREQMLLRAVDSVLAQRHKDFELIVVDDGSELPLLSTQRKVEAAGQRLFRIEHAGVSAARNFAVRQSTGEWLAFLDSDDVWLPEKLAAQVLFHRQNPKYLISQTEETWYRNGKRVNRKKYHVLAQGNAFEDSIQRCAISPSSVMIQRELFQESGGFDEALLVCEDYDLWLRLTLKNEVGLIPQQLIVKYGGHADQLSRSQPAIDRFRVYALLKLLTQRELGTKQIGLILDELQRKLLVLTTGAAKRKLAERKMYDFACRTITRWKNLEDIPAAERQKLFDSFVPLITSRELTKVHQHGKIAILA